MNLAAREFGSIARLASLDGVGSFQVNYGTGSAFAANSLVLSNFVAVPEPSTWALMVGAWERWPWRCGAGDVEVATLQLNLASPRRSRPEK